LGLKTRPRKKIVRKARKNSQKSTPAHTKLRFRSYITRRQQAAGRSKFLSYGQKSYPQVEKMCKKCVFFLAQKFFLFFFQFFFASQKLTTPVKKIKKAFFFFGIRLVFAAFGGAHTNAHQKIVEPKQLHNFLHKFFHLWITFLTYGQRF